MDGLTVSVSSWVEVLLTTAGPLFVDFEEVCVGPPDWDLADLTAEAVAAYPHPVDLALQPVT